MVMPDEVHNPYTECISLLDRVIKLRSYLRHEEDIKILDEVIYTLEVYNTLRYPPPKA